MLEARVQNCTLNLWEPPVLLEDQKVRLPASELGCYRGRVRSAAVTDVPGDDAEVHSIAVRLLSGEVIGTTRLKSKR